MHREENTRRTERRKLRHQRKKIKETSSDQMGSGEEATQKAKINNPNQEKKEFW